MMELHELYLKAEERVNNDERLSAHRNVILTDWPNEADHYEWVISAPVDAIVDWAETVERD